MDAALRAAERTYASDPTPEAAERLHEERTRAGLMCDECGLLLAEVGDSEHRCCDCRESALEHGHRHGMHDEPVEHCPHCVAEREAPGTALCSDCGRETLVWPGSKPLASGDELQDTCAHCQQ